jgi:hypothetical protein
MPGQSLADLPPVITVKETARLLRLSRSAAYRRIGGTDRGVQAGRALVRAHGAAEAEAGLP